MRKLSRRKIFYVYALLDPRRPGPFYYGHWKFSHEPFYIGKGQNGRAFCHEKHSGKDDSIKNRKIRKILSEDKQPIVVIKRKGLTEKQALTLEIFLIAKIGRLNKKEGPLSNLTDGGEGHSGFIPSEEIIEKRRLTIISRTKEEKAEVSAKLSAAFHSKTPEERAVINDKRKETYAKKTPDQLKEIFEKTHTESAKKKRAASVKRTWERKTKEEKAAISEKLKEVARNRTPEEKEARLVKVRATLDSRSQEEKDSFKRKVSRNSKKAWANRSPAQRKAFSLKIAAGVKEQHRRMGHRVK